MKRVNTFSIIIDRLKLFIHLILVVISYLPSLFAIIFFIISIEKIIINDIQGFKNYSTLVELIFIIFNLITPEIFSLFNRINISNEEINCFIIRIINANKIIKPLFSIIRLLRILIQ